LLAWGIAYAGTYADSAHGHTTYGVDRTSTSQYAQGHCGHCHEQHSSIGGVVPEPDYGPASYLVFGQASTGQFNNWCFYCHVSSGGYQDGNIFNYSYSYTFGGNTSAGSYDSDIKEAFSHASSGSTHSMGDLASQALNKWMYDADGNKWGYTNLNPCSLCHNPHLSQQDYPVTRPSDRQAIWGDDPSERMNQYNYQAPYWYQSTTTFEPANDGIQDGSNLTDYTRLCTDCHNPNNTIYSTNPQLPGGPRNIRVFTWYSQEGVQFNIHGNENGGICELRDPYSTYKLLSCTDCHEPHGSSNNIYLWRTSINGRDVSAPDNSNSSWVSFCSSCHDHTGHHFSHSCDTCHTHDAVYF
jgi:hypothetical protein